MFAAHSMKKLFKPACKKADITSGINNTRLTINEDTNLATRNHKRALKAIRVLRSRHDKQLRQIDMLCSDMVSAHKEFALKLGRLNFAVSFYEALLAGSDCEEILDIAVQSIRGNINGVSAAVFLLADNGFNVHLADAGISDNIAATEFQDWFTRELVGHISQANRVCSLDQMLRMGLQGPPAIMKTLSAAAVPLGRFGQGLGFIFVYRYAADPLTSEELSRVAAISSGLRDALHRFMPAVSHAKAGER